MQFFQFIFVNLFITISLYVYGSFLIKKNSKFYYASNIALSCIYGSIIVSFVSLILNFFVPINLFIGNIFIIISTILFLKTIYFEKKRNNIIYFIVIISLVSSLLLIFENINRPDAGLYHIPFIQIIQENKILIGINNIHFRYGHISIVQYLSAIFNNSIMPIEAMLAPIAIIVSSFYLFLASFFKKNYQIPEVQIFVFFISVYVFYSFNRYSNFGNDATAHLFFFLFLIKFYETITLNKNYEIGDIFLISTFAFLQKPFMVFLFFFTLIIYLKFYSKNLNIIKNKKIIFSSILIIFWLVKNILNSGCLIYPIKKTCLENLEYFDLNQTQQIEIESESWSKDWPNRNKNISDMEFYNKDFNWLDTWKNNHFKKLKSKFVPFIFFLLIFSSISYVFYKKKNQSIDKIKLIDKYIFMICLIFSTIWFLKFPIYRYGQSFIAGTAISIVTIFFNSFIQTFRLNKIMKLILIILFFVVTLKNIKRIYENYEHKNIWPNIYTLSENKNDNTKKKLSAIYNQNKLIYYYSKSGECLFNKSPCSNYLYNNVIKKEKYGYQIFIKN